MFVNLNVDDTSLVFSDKLLEILSMYIPNNIITCNDRDAPWIPPELKTAIKRNAWVYRKWVKRGRNDNDRFEVHMIQNNTNKLIREANQAYFKKLGEKCI